MVQLSSSPSHDRLQEFGDELEREKIELSQAVKDYIAQHVRILEEKMSKGEGVTEDDMKFIDDVKMWVGLPEEWRVMYPNIERMQEDKELKQHFEEAQKRHISVQQWLDLLHVAKASGNPREWIDVQFAFPGGKQIEIDDSLLLRDLESLTHLPENLKVKSLSLINCNALVSLGENLQVYERLIVRDCESIRHLPENFVMGITLVLINCKNLNNLPGALVLETLSVCDCPSLTSLPEHLIANALNIEGCTTLSRLPKVLNVEWMNLRGCTSLTHLPGDLEVDGDIVLSQDLQSRVQEDAKRLKKEGKIKGKIEYR